MPTRAKVYVWNVILFCIKYKCQVYVPDLLSASLSETGDDATKSDSSGPKVTGSVEFWGIHQEKKKQNVSKQYESIVIWAGHYKHTHVSNARVLWVVSCGYESFVLILTPLYRVLDLHHLVQGVKLYHPRIPVRGDFKSYPGRPTRTWRDANVMASADQWLLPYKTTNYCSDVCSHLNCLRSRKAERCQDLTVFTHQDSEISWRAHPTISYNRTVPDFSER